MGLLLCARCAAAAAEAATPPAAQRPESPHQLPVELRDVTAVLSAPNSKAPQGRTLVYVLGMSHVSRRSLGHIEHLISLVSGACHHHPSGRTHGLTALCREMNVSNFRSLTERAAFSMPCRGVMLSNVNWRGRRSLNPSRQQVLGGTAP